MRTCIGCHPAVVQRTINCQVPESQLFIFGMYHKSNYGYGNKACSAPFDSKGKSHVDGGHHGDGIEGEEKVWDEKEMESGAENGETKKGVENEEPGLQSKLPDRLEQHGDEVDKVASCQNRQKLEGGHIILDMCFYIIFII